MVKIIFEVSKDLIANNASEETRSAKMKAAEGDKALRVLFDSIAFQQLNKEIEAGKTEFVVSPNVLDEKSMNMYNHELGDICMLAYLSELDKKEEKKED